VISPIQNSDVADSFEEVADLLEIEHENRFRVMASRVACGAQRRAWEETLQSS